MKEQDLFNIDILVTTQQVVKRLGKVTAMNIMESSTTNFHPEGLFSTEIFGQVGSEARNTSFGHIDIKIPIMHPEVYNHVCSLKTIYKGILSGSEYAEWDPKEKDFVISNVENGKTGYAFFMEHYDEIAFRRTPSEERENKIKYIDKSGRSNGLMQYILVEPAGLRDYRIDKNGQPSQDEINDYYRKFIINSSMLDNIDLKPSDYSRYDAVRFRLQEAFLGMFNYIIGLLQGKSKFIQGKWGKRGIMAGTRNVITPLPSKVHNLKDKSRILSFNNTGVGLYQYAASLDDLTYHKIMEKISQNVFSQGTSSASLADMKTLTTTTVSVKNKTYDAWMSVDGLRNIIKILGQEDMRNEDIVVDGHYLALVYDDGKTIIPIFNTHELPEELNRKKIRPIKYYEAVYYAIADTVGKYPSLLTRYPVAGFGGIYPTIPYVKTTVGGRKVTVKNIHGDIVGVYPEYPVFSEKFFNALSPHYAHLARLGADFDGDMMTFTTIVTNEARQEIMDLFQDRSFYITPDNKVAFSGSTTDLDIVSKIMTA